ncbi:hypothetical protein [Shuttleworthella sp. MSX8B]
MDVQARISKKLLEVQ